MAYNNVLDTTIGELAEGVVLPFQPDIGSLQAMQALGMPPDNRNDMIPRVIRILEQVQNPTKCVSAAIVPSQMFADSDQLHSLRTALQDSGIIPILSIGRFADAAAQAAVLQSFGRAVHIELPLNITTFSISTLGDIALRLSGLLSSCQRSGALPVLEIQPLCNENWKLARKTTSLISALQMLMAELKRNGVWMQYLAVMLEFAFPTHRHDLQGPDSIVKLNARAAMEGPDQDSPRLLAAPFDANTALAARIFGKMDLLAPIGASMTIIPVVHLFAHQETLQVTDGTWQQDNRLQQIISIQLQMLGKGSLGESGMDYAAAHRYAAQNEIGWPCPLGSAVVV